MSTNVNTEFTPLMVSVQEGFQAYLPSSSESAKIALSSSALIQIGLATIKNLPYVTAADKFGINDFSHVFSSRVNYLELGLVSLAIFIHNLVMAMIYTILAVATLGLSQNLNFGCKKHWYHSYHAIVGVGVGLTGMVSPTFGVYGSALFGYATIRSIQSGYQSDVKLFEQDLVKEIKGIYKKHKELINKATLSQVGLERFNHEFGPSYEYIEEKLNLAENMDHLVDLAIEFWHHFPIMGDENQNEVRRRRSMNTLGSTAAHHHYANV